MGETPMGGEKDGKRGVKMGPGVFSEKRGPQGGRGWVVGRKTEPGVGLQVSQTYLQSRSDFFRQPNTRAIGPTRPSNFKAALCCKKPLMGARPVPAATITMGPRAFKGSLKPATCTASGSTLKPRTWQDPDIYRLLTQAHSCAHCSAGTPHHAVSDEQLLSLKIKGQGHQDPQVPPCMRALTHWVSCMQSNPLSPGAPKVLAAKVRFRADVTCAGLTME